MAIDIQAFSPNRVQDTITRLIKWAPHLCDYVKPADVQDIAIRWTDFDNNSLENLTNNYPFLEITSRTRNKGTLKAINRYVRDLGLPSTNYADTRDIPSKLELYTESGPIGQGILFAEPALRQLVESGELEQYFSVIHKLNKFAGVDLNSEHNKGGAEFKQRDILGLKWLLNGSPDLVVEVNLGPSLHKPASNTQEGVQAYYERKSNVAARFRDELNKTLGTQLQFQRDYSTQHYDVHYDYYCGRDYQRDGTPKEAQARAKHTILNIPVGPLLQNLKSVDALLDKYLGQERSSALAAVR